MNFIRSLFSQSWWMGTYCSFKRVNSFDWKSPLRVVCDFSVAKREYPRFLKRFTSYVIEQTRNKPILFWWSLFLTHWHSICILVFFLLCWCCYIYRYIYFFLLSRARHRLLVCLYTMWWHEYYFNSFVFDKINIEEIIIPKRKNSFVLQRNCSVDFEICQ